MDSLVGEESMFTHLFLTSEELYHLEQLSHTLAILKRNLVL